MVIAGPAPSEVGALHAALKEQSLMWVERLLKIIEMLWVKCQVV